MKERLAGEILDEKAFFEHLIPIMEWKNLTLEKVYGAEPTTVEQLKEWYDNYCIKLMPFIGDLEYFFDYTKDNEKNVQLFLERNGRSASEIRE